MLNNLVAERRFRAMNTDIRLITTDWTQTALLARAEAVFHAVEARFSRFLPDSELSALNRSEGVFEASEEMVDLLALAMRFNTLTNGIFEPAVLPNLEAAGYDRSFERVEKESVVSISTGPVLYSIVGIEIDRRSGRIRKPSGLRIDLGGIGKGYAVDQVAAVLAPAHDFLIDAGGDIFAAGLAPGDEDWRIGVAAPREPQSDLAAVVLRDQAIATSTTVARRWQRDGRWLNHIIDPRAGTPVEASTLSVSVIAASATEADVFAKTVLVLGPEAGPRFVDNQVAAGFFVFEDGTILKTRNWPAGPG